MNILSKLFGGKGSEEKKCEGGNCSHEDSSCEKNVENILDMAENAGSGSSESDSNEEHTCDGSCSHEEKEDGGGSCCG